MSLFLVTGGAGFIGSNIVGELLGRGENVRILDNFATGRRQNIERLIRLAGGNGFVNQELKVESEKLKADIENLNLSNQQNEIKNQKLNKKIKDKKNVTNSHKNSSLEIIEGDVRSYHIVREAVEGVEFILHQAALPSVPRSVKDPITSNEVNVVGTLNVLNAAKDANVKRIVFASSSSVYGDLEFLPKTEDMLPKPLSP